MQIFLDGTFADGDAQLQQLTPDVFRAPKPIFRSWVKYTSKTRRISKVANTPPVYGYYLIRNVNLKVSVVLAIAVVSSGAG